MTLLLLRLSVRRLTVSNYRGVEVKVVGGAALAGSVALIEAVGWTSGDDAGSTARIGLLILALGFFLLGLADDLFGDRTRKGLAGHLKALGRGRVTTGAVKAAGGLAVAGLVSLWWDDSAWLSIVDMLLIALSANLINLLDLRPGRASKAFLILWLPLYAAPASSDFRELSAVLAGATAAWLYADLTERGMLGDSGANMLGAVLGAGVVLTAAPAGRIVVVAVLAGLTLASERWSFSSAIERLAPLRWLDGLGRISPGGTSPGRR